VNRLFAFVSNHRSFPTQNGWFLAMVVLEIGFWTLQASSYSEAQQPGAGKAAVPAAAGKAAAPVPYRAIAAAPDAERAERKKEKDEMLKGGVPFDTKKIEMYYGGYLFSGMTNEGALEKANAARLEIMEDIDKSEKTGGPSYDTYVELLTRICTAISRGHYHPTASINSVLILNRLNKGKAKIGETPTPHDKVTALLLEFSTKGLNEGIQAAALSGLERHAEFGSKAWDDAVRKRIAGDLVASIKQPSPAKRPVRADAWLKGRKLEILTKFKHPMEGDLYQLALDALADTTSDPILVEKSLYVEGSYPPPANLNPESTKKALANVASFTKTKVFDWQKWMRESPSFAPVVENTKKPEPKSKSKGMANDGDGGGGGEDMGDGGGRSKKEKAAPKTNPFLDLPPEVKQKRRALHEILETIRFGLNGTRFGEHPATNTTGLAMLITDAEQSQILRDILVDIKDLQEALNKQTLGDKTGLDLETGPKIEKLGKDLDDFQIVLGFEPTPTPEPTAPTDGTDPSAN
jgi:hypothetical protein